MKTSNNHYIAINRQQGLTLVELLIAMAISITLLAGITQIVVSNKDTYNFQQSQSMNQENSRFAYFFIDEVLLKAGYMSAPQNFRDAVFGSLSASTECASFKAGQIISNSLEGTGFCVRYQPFDTTEVDCSGNTIATTSPFVTRVFFDANTNSLMCGAQGAAATALVGDIENMQVTYGFSNDSDIVGRSIDAYVATPPDWVGVVAIQTAILTASDSETLDIEQVYRFPLNAAATTTATDKRSYRSSIKTITLRNAVM